MPYLIIILAALLLAAGVVEGLRQRRRLSRLPIRILVNGTRGKTSVTRLVAAALQAGGIPTMAKCTGSDATEILPDGSQTHTARPRGARISEIKGFCQRAVDLGARAIVVECMAVQPERQQALAQHLVRPTIVIITNALVDHVDELGNTREQTAAGLSQSLRKGCELVSEEPAYRAWPRLHPGDDLPLPEGYAGRFSFPVFEQNLRLALRAAELAGVEREDALRGMVNASPDIGMAGPFCLGQSLIINAFAANDPVSTQHAFELALPQMQSKPSLAILYNHRVDRAYRMHSFLPFLKAAAAHQPRFLITGEKPADAARYFAGRQPIKPEVLPPDQLLSADFYEAAQAVFCMGNIKGAGVQMIRFCQERGEEGQDAKRDRP